MLITHDAVGVSTLLNTLAQNVNRSRNFIDQQALPYQIPEVDASFKLALTSLTGAHSDQPELRVATIRPGQARIPVSSLGTKLIACPPRQITELHFSVVSSVFETDELTITMDVVQSDRAPDQMAAVEVNLDRQLAGELNFQPLSFGTFVDTPVIQPGSQGQIVVCVKVDAADQGAVKLPLHLSALGRHQTLIFTTAN